MRRLKLYARFLKLFGFCFMLHLVLSGCEHLALTEPQPIPPGSNEVDTLATFSAIQRNILDTKCALSGCHVGGSTQLPGVLDLREGVACQNLVNVPSIEKPEFDRIEPGQPDSSYLFLKIVGTNIVGQRMPFGRDPLTQREIDAVRKWISGAANN